jgi:TonB family protein
METYLIYIGKSAIAAGAFYIAFLLLFQNQKHFTFNRIYLPVSLALSFVIPLITFTTIKYIEPANFDANSFAYLAPASGEIVQPAFVFEWYHYLFGMYLLGTAGFLFHLLLGHLKAINIIQKSRIQKIFNNLVNITQKDVHPFSFFSKIVVSEKTLSHPDLEMIVSHEDIHVREKHTLDILFTEIMFLFQWFNPFAWLLKDAVKNNLEYLTDHEIAKHYNQKTYQLAMVTLADKQGIAPFLTALNGSQLKNRIVMMKKKTENKYAILKQLLVLPLLAVLVMGLSNREVKTEVIQKENQLESKLESNQIKSDSLKMNNKEFMSQLYHDGLFELQDYGEGAPLIFLNGKEVIEKVIFDESDFKTSQILPPKEAVERFGERGNNGAMIFETKTNYLQKEAIKGKVTNEKGEPLVGASVIIKGNTVGTITDTKGNYEIKSEGEIETLLFGKDGYEMMEVKTNGRKNIDVKLEVDNKLYIVDGKEYEGKTGEIDPDNIGRIDILKGESGFKLYGDKGKNGVVLIFTKSTNNQGDPIFYKVDTLPEFPGGETALRNFLASEIKYPEIARENGILGKVYVTFIITKEGKVTEPTILRGVDPALDKEALRVIETLPDWKPGKQKGEAVNVSYMVPVYFELKETTADKQAIYDLRKKIAQTIKYPVVAQENNQQGVIDIWAIVAKDGTIINISEKRLDGQIINIDEVVVTSYKSEKTLTSEKSKDLDLLIKESKRVIEQLSPLNIPELAGETVSFRIRFVLQ